MTNLLEYSRTRVVTSNVTFQHSISSNQVFSNIYHLSNPLIKYYHISLYRFSFFMPVLARLLKHDFLSAMSLAFTVFSRLFSYTVCKYNHSNFTVHPIYLTQVRNVIYGVLIVYKLLCVHFCQLYVPLYGISWFSEASVGCQIMSNKNVAQMLFVVYQHLAVYFVNTFLNANLKVCLQRLR